MRASIATVSMGGASRENLDAISEAGFEGLDVFETDPLAHDAGPADNGRMARDHGLEIVAQRPFRDFEGMPEVRRAHGFKHARREFQLMNELGTEKPLVCSNISPRAQGGIDRAARESGQAVPYGRIML